LDPTGPEQVPVYWAISTVVFLLTVIVGFMLFRAAMRLYTERRSNREGSRIRTKLVLGALALCIVPVFFLVLWSVQILNFNIQRWFSRPAEGIRLELVEVGQALEREVRAKLDAQARWIATLEQVKAAAAGRTDSEYFSHLCRDHAIDEMHLAMPGGDALALCSEPQREIPARPLVAKVSVSGLGDLIVRSHMTEDLAMRQRELQHHVAQYDQLAVNRKEARSFYIRLLLLITLFILFVAIWLALFMAKQISVPISALLGAAGEVRKGNLRHRVNVDAMDELASLVRAFNEMTQGLETNREELEARRRFTEAILESIPTGVISVTSDGRIQKVNRGLRYMFPDADLDRVERLEGLFSREDTAEIRYMMKRARRTGVAGRQLEMKCGRQTLHLAVTVSAIEARLGSDFVVVLEDTSELLRAQKAAAWHEVARRIAHEIKNPLTPIALSAERVARLVERAAAAGEVPPELARTVRGCMNTVAGEVETVKTLVDEFSQFARFPAAQPVSADLNDIVEGALAVFAGRLEGVDVQKELAPNLPPVFVDREQFRRVVVNLVDNAAEAMQESLVKALYVGTAAGVDTVELIVADTGHGISPEDKEKLFLPYFSTKNRGTGLGLAIVSHILSEHRAHIRVVDNQPVGARFIVEIPALVPAEPAVQEVRA
jgi:nitrogen fixation/metabolism regulation signal transduction histidine kinase